MPVIIQHLDRHDLDVPGGSGDALAVVPAGGWQIETIETVGTTGTPGTATVDVTFYTNNAGLPGTALAACTYAGLTPVDTAGSLTITLPAACSLSAGTYWMAIQVNQSYGAAGQHFWSNRTVASGSNAVWRNPGNGFATGCTTFTAMTTCGVGGGTARDFLFQLNGSAGPPPADLSLTKSAGASAVSTGSLVTYTLAVQHVSGGAATGVVVTDALPGSLVYVSNSCGASFAGGTLTWNVGSVAVGGSATCNLTARVMIPGAITNSASLTAVEPDPVTTNNASSAAIAATGDAVIPALGPVGLAALALALAVAGLAALRRPV